MRLSHALGAAVALRVLLIAWGTYQDATSSVKYTDIDYVVFSDAARCLVWPASSDCSRATGPLAPSSLGDPYARDTYRYTPLLALLATPNILLHSLSAKVLFSVADLVVGLLLYSLLRKRHCPPATSTNYVAGIWLLNPIIANISTRGSAESILGVLVVAVLALADAERWDAAALGFGLAVHFKIFPVIYASSLLAALAARTPHGRKWFSQAQVRFAVLSFVSFMVLNVAMFALWGTPFVEHTFLYHAHRLDHRHNFSPYFYSFYLSTEGSAPAFALADLLRHPLAAFVPQLGLSLALGLVFGAEDLAFAWLVQTYTFVTFNKVCTSQYFLWYLWLLPPTLPRLYISRGRATLLIAAWVLSQGLWLSQAYRLEMLGDASYVEIWASSVVFFVVNCWVLSEIVGGYQPVKVALPQGTQQTR